MLMREVDEAVRTDHVGDIARKYGIAIGAALVLALAAFGGWLFWQSQKESGREAESEQLVIATDQLEAGNLDIADEQLAALAADGGPGAAASATLLRAGIALQQGRSDEAAALFRQVANDSRAPQAYRDLALIRAVTTEYDDLQPQQVIEQLGPLASAGNPWFGSAGELVAMAYLEQGNTAAAGPLLAQIAQDDNVPPTLRSRTRQLAGVLGFDAVEDVEQTLAEVIRAEAIGPAGSNAPIEMAPAE